MHDGMQYDPIKVRVTSPSEWEIRPFSTAISSAIYNGSGQKLLHMTSNVKMQVSDAHRVKKQGF